MRRRLTPASSRWVAQEWRRVWTDACVWRPLALRASRNAPCTRLLGIGAVAVDRGDPATTRRREDQHGMAMGDPVWAQQGQRVVWPGDIEISPACAMPAVDQPASALEILQLQMGALLQAQTTGVDRGEADSVAQQADTAENRSNLFEAQEHWQFFLARGAHKAAGRPVSGEGVREEARDAAQCNRAGAPRVRLDMLEVQ